MGGTYICDSLAVAVATREGEERDVETAAVEA